LKEYLAGQRFWYIRLDQAHVIFLYLLFIF